MTAPLSRSRSADKKLAELRATLLRAMLDYDPASGLFTWRCHRNARVRANMIAGGRDAAGYVVIPLGGRYYKAHRLAFLHVTGEWPRQQVDHINGVRSDNRWENLREASPAENAANRKRRSNNKSGFKGVSWSERDRRWVASIRLAGKLKHLGSFSTPDEAHRVYAAAASATFGKFARTS